MRSSFTVFPFVPGAGRRAARAPPGGGGQAVRARVAARAMASMVSAGSSMSMTWQSVHCVVGGSRLGARMMTPQPARCRRVMRCWPPASRVGVGGVGDDDQQAGGAGAGEAERAVEGVDRAAEPLGAVGGAEVGDPGGDLAGAGEGVDAAPVQDGGGAGGGQVRGGAGEDPGGRGDRAGEGAHGAGDVAGDADAQGRGGDPAAAGAGEGLGGGDRPGGALRLGGQGLAHAEPAGRDLRGGR